MAKKPSESPVRTAAPPPTDSTTAAFLRRFERAKSNRDTVAQILDEAYEYALPLRQRSYLTAPSDKRTDRLFDSTAVEALQDFASQMLEDVWPTDSKPFELRAGPEIPAGERDAADRKLAEVADDVIETINNSAFRSAAHEAMQDYGIGTGVLMIEDGDAAQPVRFTCVPLTEALLDSGPWGDIDALFRERRPKAREIPVLWPGADLGDELGRIVDTRPDDEVVLVEGVERDWSQRGTETWSYACVWPEKRRRLKSGEYRGWGSRPFVAFNFTRTTGEIIGRGPVQIALPDIKTLNLVKQFVLENADLAISGLWQYEDDGVVNPETIAIAPGTLIPKARGAKGLEALKPGADFDVAQFVIEDLQNGIRRILLSNDLGPPTGTPMSATEVMQRTVDRARRMSGPYGRLLTEFLFPVVTRVARIRVNQGALKLPALDGRQVAIRPLSQITRAQAQDDILRHDRYLELMNARLGPQVTQLMLDGEKYGAWLARKIGVDPGLVRNAIERKQLAAGIAAAAAAMTPQGGAA